MNKTRKGTIRPSDRGSPCPVGLGIILLCLAATLWAAPAPAAQVSSDTGEQVRTEIPYSDGDAIKKVVLISDTQGTIGENTWQAGGNVKVYFEDILITTDEVVINQETKEGYTVGKTHFSQGEQWLTCSKAQFNFGTQTGTFYDASGFTDKEFLITGRTIIKTGRDTYTVLEGSVTTCREENPKWQFTASRSEIRLDHTARLRHTLLKVKGFPVFYTPYTIIPLERKTRSSGFTTFSTGTSTSKGRVFSQGYYQTLGRSADMMIYGDYFSLRGLALGGILRTRPNQTTYLDIHTYGIRDSRDQGGVQLIVDGESRFKNGWRAVARVNITSSFEFRQVFADSFNQATKSQEYSTAFLTRNHESFSANIAFERNEVTFPGTSLITRKIPSLEFLSIGTPLGNSPFIFSFKSSIDGISRRDSQTETAGIVHRLDVYPRLTLRLPPLLGFSLTPSVGFRETYYGAQISEIPEEGIINLGLHRQYADLNIDMKMPSLVKNYNASWLGTFRHTIEPYTTFRWTDGIEDPRSIIRFDENDAVADTREIEYGFVNRFFTKKQDGAGTEEKHEFMSVALIQKYYFDPSFGRAFEPGHANTFYPLNTATGFYQTGIERNLSPISAIVRIWQQNRMHHDFRSDYDIELQRWRNISLSTEWDRNKFSLAATYFRTMQTEPELIPSNNLQASVGYGTPARGFASNLTIRYNFQTSQLLNSRTRLSYAWNCCGVSTEFRQYSLRGRIESQFSISFSLKGIGSFGTMQRQDYLF
ncbi:MAG: hypothetical protein JXR49_14630 [Acidobacteria bacterium]|nr:hypothetical protein [Acidobacteriota bacterium]